jgi:probable F420-dependent oxidoreductase
MRPFRFAVQLTSAPDAKAWRDRARQVEDMGYSALFMPDHFGDQWAPLVGLTVAAEATTTLRVGSLVFDNDYRHPVALAKEIATLDLVSDGRVEFGIGAGWLTTDYQQSGIPLDRPGVRIDRMVEGLAIMKDLWAEGTSTRSGRYYQVERAEGFPRPPRGCPPIIIGGGGKRVLSIAAREADIIGLNPSLAAGAVGPEVAASSVGERYRERIEWVREAAGDRFDQLEFQILTFFVQIVPNRAEALANLGALFGVTADQAAEIPMALVGTVDEICESLVRRREQLGASYWVLHEPEIEALAPVVARLAGT